MDALPYPPHRPSSLDAHSRHPSHSQNSTGTVTWRAQVGGGHESHWSRDRRGIEVFESGLWDLGAGGWMLRLAFVEFFDEVQKALRRICLLCSRPRESPLQTEASPRAPTSAYVRDGRRRPRSIDLTPVASGSLLSLFYRFFFSLVLLSCCCLDEMSLAIVSGATLAGQPSHL